MADQHIDVVLDGKLVDIVEEAVRSGDFVSPQEVVAEALALWQRDRAEYAEELTRFRAEIDEAMNEPGPYLTTDEVKAYLDRRRSDEAA